MSGKLTEGKPLKLILAFTLPMLVGNVFQQFYSMVDTIVVGQFIGVKALAAVGATGGITFFVLGFIMGLCNGFAIIVSHRFGSKDIPGLKKVVGNSIVLAVSFCIVLSILAVIGSYSILSLLQTPSDIIHESHKYLTVIFGGLIFTMSYNLIAAILRSLGDSKTPLIFLIVSSIINIILDIVFVTVVGMGVEGTAYATIISQGISFVLCFFYTMKHYEILHIQKSDFTLDFGLVRQLLGIGLPGALSTSITAFGVMILQGAINKLGSDTVAAYTAGVKVDQFFTIPFLSLGMAAATFTGQNLGAGKLDRIKLAVKQLVFVVIGYAVVGGSVLHFAGKYLVRLFITGESSGKVIEQSLMYLDVIAVMCIFLGMVFLFRSVIQGLGNGFVPMVAGGIELVMRTICALILVNYLQFFGICIASPIAWVCCVFFLVPYYIYYIKKIDQDYRNI